MIDMKKKIIDIHAHVIPGVDDGARTMEEACRMLRMAARQGVRAVVVTPHYSRRKELSELPELTERLQEKIREYDPEFTLYTGQETYYHDGLVERLQQGKAYTMAGSSYVLVEFDEQAPYQELYKGIRALVNAGYIPVLAHMERYPDLRGKGRVEELAGNGCIFQMNYDSLQERGLRYQKEVNWCRRQVKSGQIRLLGTDMHRLDYRPPDTAGALKWLDKHVEKELLEDMICRNPLRIINNEGID